MRRVRGSGAWIALVLALGLAGCGSIARAPLDVSLAAGQAPASPLDAFRFTDQDEAAFDGFVDRWRADRGDSGQRHSRPAQPMRILAVSAGGANGAYGAGVLSGWSQAGDRPDFDLVTGVSTGALIAPFAFLGPEWDARLRDAYTDPDAARLTHGGWGLFRGPSLFGGRSLQDLVAKYVDDRLMRAVAEEHRAGRRLLVATTNLDQQATVLWDMGAIALAGEASGQREAAARLFETILVASASIPGVFPPVMIDHDGEPGGLAEMHVDGGVTSPFVLAPSRREAWAVQLSPPDHGAASERSADELYVIVNGEIDPSPSITRGAAMPILTRTFDTMSKASVKAHLISSAAFAQARGARLSYAAIPPELGADSMAFQVDAMRRLFDAGAAAGRERSAFTLLASPDATAP